MIDPHEAPVCNRADPCHICYVTKQSPHPYYLKIRPCNAHVDRHRWEILDNEGYCKRLRTHSRRSERPKIMGVWRCKVSLRYGIRNNVGLYRCRLCGGDVFLSVSRQFRLDLRWPQLSYAL